MDRGKHLSGWTAGDFASRMSVNNSDRTSVISVLTCIHSRHVFSWTERLTMT